MAVTINTNVTSLVAQRNLNKAQGSLAQSMERLSSGLAINHAKDNAAGLAIAKRLENKITGFSQGIKNGNAGISVVQNVESNFEEINNNLQRMRELATQSASGTYSDSDRLEMYKEFSSLRNEIDRVSINADFNGIKTADGSVSSISIQVGASNASSDSIMVALANLQTSAGALNISSTSISTAAGALTAMSDLDNAIDSLSSSRAGLGADQIRLETAVRNNINSIETLTAAKSTIMDVDFAKEVAEMSKTNVLVQASSAMLSQANSLPSMALSLLQG